MKRQILLPTVTVAALLSGCAGTSNDTAVNDTVTAVQESASTAANKDKEVGRLGQAYEISSLPSNDVYLTVTDIRVGGECEYGSFDAGEFNNTSGENTLLQVWAELDVQKLGNSQSGDVAVLSNPTIVDGNGYTQEAEYAIACNSPTQGGIDDWYTGRGPGEKSRVYGMFAVPADVKQIKIEGATFDVAPASAAS